MTNKISSIFSQNFIWFKSGIITFFTVFLLSVLFVSGCGRKGKSDDKNGNESKEESESKEEVDMDAFVEKCNRVHELLKLCLVEVNVPKALVPSNILLYLPPPTEEEMEKYAGEMKDCMEVYRKNLKESFKLLPQKQSEQKQKEFEEIKYMDNPLSNRAIDYATACGSKIPHHRQLICFTEITQERLCGEVE